MEHIVQFAIGFDDEGIRKRLEENAYDDILNKLVNEAKKGLSLNCPEYNQRERWKTIVDKALHNYFDENKETILDLAASKLAESYKRTKAYKEKMSNV